MNFVFISPNFPTNYWKFCRELKNNGVNVLGIGDCPYDDLSEELKGSLNEYYKVGSMENYDEVYRAVAFFTFKHGRIDWIESNNEYWLERDAKLRTDFNVNTGFKTDDMYKIKYKSGMKAFYEKAGIPVARYHMVKDLEGCREFINVVGYPVVVKPDNGVGANATYKLKCDEDLVNFMNELPPVQYIMEEFIDGQVCTYDAIIDSQGNSIFETGNVTINSVMDIVNNQEDSYYYIVKELPEDVIDKGLRTVKSFGVRSRFVHLEFFRLMADHDGLGKKGDVIALEVNMRPCGGFSPDMMNFANSVDVYKIWADMICFDHATTNLSGERYYCPFAGRRDNHQYVHNHDDIMNTYGDAMCMVERIPDALSGAMGNQMYVAKFKTYEEMEEFYRYLA